MLGTTAAATLRRLPSIRLVARSVGQRPIHRLAPLRSGAISSVRVGTMASATTRSATTVASSSGAPLHPALPASVLPNGYIKVDPDGTVRSHTRFSLPIEKSPHDEREYRLVRLDNGLEVLLVHDAKADKAAASMSVNVGHLSDPEDLQGLAHFCEHLLFMGTEKVRPFVL